MRIFTIGSDRFGLGKKVEVLNISKFGDGERVINVPVDLRGEKICLICDLSDECQLFSHLLAVNAFNHSGAGEITLIVPYLCYMRQDRLFPGQPISLEVVSSFLNNSGAKNVYLIDVHSNHLFNFFTIPVNDLSFMTQISREISKRLVNRENYTVVIPDKGAVNRVRLFNEFLDLPEAICSKYRKESGESVVTFESGEVEGRNCLIVDDILDSGGTLLNACDALKKQGARNISIVVIHALFSGNSLERFMEWNRRGIIEKVYVTDTIKRDYSSYPFVEVISISCLLSDLLDRLME